MMAMMVVEGEGGDGRESQFIESVLDPPVQPPCSHKSIQVASRSPPLLAPAFEKLFEKITSEKLQQHPTPSIALFLRHVFYPI